MYNISTLDNPFPFLYAVSIKWGETMKTTISKGNMKLGGIPNISLSPVWSCVKGVPCAKGCYAMKSYRMYPNVKTAWNNNLAMAKNETEKYFSDINDYMQNKKPAFFRWHVAGDILDYVYFNSMLVIALQNPNTKFLCFTKNYKVVNEYLVDLNAVNQSLPDNFKLYFSAWSDDTWIIDNPFDIPIAYMQDGKQIIPESAFTCPGSCEDCKHCFVNGNAVVFKKH